ncbi:GTPase [Natranaerobius thermophilus]|uniref:GTP-binding protein HSR1-related n=1 Tax=Natranaerobius thermophilus (strain ATCC BAA-1301 / DSM 18059 / JW/NM-WN-LF) TaxID=457570 RepID=B2A7M7_NATTJ|nr:GTPase [Natranaerobius thermophilus]ACB85736.1 GTP-binding protein HSR1-related [Natranaerobius thermophilus JW/NM-WN-LF]
MPANLPPQYYEAEEAYRKATTPEDKMEALKTMLKEIPKHKGTEKLQADIKRRMARLREEEDKKKKSYKSTYNPFHIEKQGAGQIVLVGYPNTGKSSLVATLTRAKAKVADYPYSTALPLPGMMPYRDTWVQLVDTPPVMEDSIASELIGTIRNADALLIMIDAGSDDCLDQLEGCLNLLQDKGVIDLSEDGEIVAPIPYMVVAMKMDLPGAKENMDLIKEFNPELTIWEAATDGTGLDQLREELFEILEVIRVYGKPAGKPVDTERPFILRKGSTVLDFAETVHRDFPDKLQSALVWGSARFDGQAVPQDHVLEDGDIVELQIR